MRLVLKGGQQLDVRMSGTGRGTPPRAVNPLVSVQGALRQDAVDHLAVHVRQAEVPTLIRVRQAGVVDA